ncbi:MAG: hypothetical protein KDJ65_34530 [Anaerolineae bacterium]|nr:hypothetical protein [Anaerolineae bacterium]
MIDKLEDVTSPQTPRGLVAYAKRATTGEWTSLVWTELNVGYSCSGGSLSFLQGAVDMQGCPSKSDPAWPIPTLSRLTA